jgi:hypothetical protein
VDNNKYLRRNVRAAGINIKNTRKTLSFSDAAYHKGRAVKMSLLMGENVEMEAKRAAFEIKLCQRKFFEFHENTIFAF